MKNNDKKKIGLIIEKVESEYDFTSQTFVIIEELAELTQAITKIMRYGLKDGLHENLVEEIADVYIVLEELKKLQNVNEKDIEKIITEKTGRTLLRMGVKNGN